MLGLLGRRRNVTGRVVGRRLDGVLVSHRRGRQADDIDHRHLTRIIPKEEEIDIALSCIMTIYSNKFMLFIL